MEKARGMRHLPLFSALLLAGHLFALPPGEQNSMPNDPLDPSKQMLVRIAELEIDPVHLEQYKAFLREEAEASVRLEPGVISILPMYSKDKPAAIRIVEIYANRAAYEAHLRSPQFLKYKTTTANMVRSLNLIDMEVLAPESLPAIFRKIPQR